MENNSIKFDKDTPAIVAANKVQSLMAVNKDTGEVGNVEFPLLVQEAGKHVADAVKVTGDVLPTLGDANKRYSFTTGSSGRTLTHGSTSLVYGANKQCSAFWDGVAKVWTKEDEIGLPESAADGVVENLNDKSVSGGEVFSKTLTKSNYIDVIRESPNLFDNTKIQVNRNLRENGEMSGEVTLFDTSDWIKVERGTYVVSGWFIRNPNDQYYSLFEKYGDSVPITPIKYQSTNGIIEIEQDCYIVLVTRRTPGSGVEDVKDTLQFEKGDTPTEYKPYSEKVQEKIKKRVHPYF